MSSVISFHSLYDISHPQQKTQCAWPLMMVIDLQQQLRGYLRDVAPCSLDVMRFGGARADGEAQHKVAAELARHQVDRSVLVDLFKQLLVQLIGFLERGGRRKVS